MKVYVAGRTNDLARVKRAQEWCRQQDWQITYDWTENVNAQSVRAESGGTDPATLRQYALNDRQGVRDADLVIVMTGPNLLGTAIEIGMAIERDTPVWLVGEPERDSVFFYLDTFTRIDEELLYHTIVTQRREQASLS
jgi:nucleoside 2-deoxyribosyltransferase